MVRTQIYLTERQRRVLSQMTETTGKKQSELIREAIDQLIDHRAGKQQQATLERAAGLWKDRDDLPDVDDLRQSWDRS